LAVARDELVVGETDLAGAMNERVPARNDLLGEGDDFVEAVKDHVPAMKDLRCTRHGDVSCHERLVFPNEEGSFSLQNIVVLLITPRGVVVKGQSCEAAAVSRGIGIR
jgi:hypothetical protein